MNPNRLSFAAASSNHRSGNGPMHRSPSSSPLRPLLPFYDAETWANRRRYATRRRHLDLGLGQMMMNHRSSLLSTASLALIGAARSKTLAEIIDEEKLNSRKRCWSKAKKVTQIVYEKSRLKHFLPLLILVGYSFLGGGVIYWIEAPIERMEIEGKQKLLNDQRDVLINQVWDIKEKRFAKRPSLMTLREAVHWYTITTMYMDGNLTRLPPPANEAMTRVGVLKKYTEEMAQRCWEIRLESHNRSDAERLIQDSLKLFELFTGVTTEVKPVWTFSNALFLAVTIYTTIGYGSVAPHTVAGRVATIIYAIIGIPVYLMILHKLGRVFLKLLHKLWCMTLKFTRCLTCVRNSYSDVSLGQTGANLKMTGVKENDCNIPVSLAVGVTFVWMLACAGVCCLFFETSWDYFTSFYFFFISLTTIGFGDVTPTHPEYMFTMFGLIIVGLSLVSMCINVVQLKLELLFEEMMLAMMEEYEKRGQIMDGDMIMESALFQRGLGVVQMMKLWTRRKRASETLSASVGELLASRKRRGAFLRELQGRRRARSIATQTEFWNDDLDAVRYDKPPWMMTAFERRQMRKAISFNTATQTDWSDLSALESYVSYDQAEPTVYPTYVIPDQRDSVRSLSSSLITCDDDNVFVNTGAIIKDLGIDFSRPTATSNETGFGRTLRTIELGSDQSDDSVTGSSPDILPFIPYIEQEVPLEHEQGPIRRWSAAEAMSVFSNWAAARGLDQPQVRLSRSGSDGNDDDKLASFQNRRKLSSRRMTVAAGVQPTPSSSQILNQRLDSARCRAAGFQGTVSRIQSRQPSYNDLKALASESDRATPTGNRLTVDKPTSKKYSGISTLPV